MKKIHSGLIPGVVLLAYAALFTACGAKEGPAASDGTEARPAAAETVTETEDLAPVEAPEIDEGIITYFSGDVFILDSSEWWEVEIGELITKDDLLKTEAASYCEIQFGETAVVRIQENTEIAVKTLALSPGESQVGLNMKQGSILCKVQKLTGTEKFKVETQTAVCGVRGTEFAVTSGTGRETKLAVKEGAVTVLPSSVDIDRLKEQSAGKGAEVGRLLDEIENSAPVVEANQEIDISASLLQDTEESVREVEQAVREIASAETEQAVEEKVGNLEKAVEKTSLNVARAVAPPKQLSEESRTNLGEIDKMQILRIAPQPGVSETAEAAAESRPEPVLIRLAVQVQPKEAVIELDGDRVGTGRFSGLYPEGQNLRFSIRAPGYQQHTLNILTGADTSKSYTVSLGKLPEAEPEQAEVPEEEAAAEEPKKREAAGKTVTEADKEAQEERIETSSAKLPEEVKVQSITVETSPRDAVISVNGTRAGSGSFSRQYKEGTELQVAVERQGYEPESLNIAVGSGKNTHSVRLTPKTVQTDTLITSGKIVGSVISGAGRIYSSDSEGRVTAADIDGNVLWSIETGNSPNENSYPVFAGNMIYFSGSKELIIAGAADGRIAARVPLEGQSAHLFGRRVVPYKGDLLFPTNESIQIRDSRSGAVKREIELSRGSRMTPGLWNDWIVIADQQGSLLIIDPEADTPVIGDISSSAVQPVALGVTVWNDRAFFSGRKGTVVCIDLVNQQLLWERKLPGGTPVFTDLKCDGNGVFAFSKGTLYALSVRDGADLFAPVQGATSPPACGGSRFYYGAGPAVAVADASSGRELRRIPVSGTVNAQPVLEGPKLFGGTENGSLLVINP